MSDYIFFNKLLVLLSSLLLYLPFVYTFIISYSIQHNLYITTIQSYKVYISNNQEEQIIAYYMHIYNLLQILVHNADGYLGLGGGVILPRAIC